MKTGPVTQISPSRLVFQFTLRQESLIKLSEDKKKKVKKSWRASAKGKEENMTLKIYIILPNNNYHFISYITTGKFHQLLTLKIESTFFIKLRVFDSIYKY